jgi:small conductance mechanosensitive channel
MQQDKLVDELQEEVTWLATQPNFLRSTIILILSLVAAYLFSHFVGQAIVKLAQKVAIRSDSARDTTRAIRLRRVETYLSVTVALIRGVLVAVIAYTAWRILSPNASSTLAAAVGASAFIFVIAGATIGMVLRDITSGAVMIIERWFNVGDYIRVDPFWELGGVVERVTLRSTKLRSLNGEVVWLHNQHIHGVRVTPHGTRTIKVEVFVSDETKGKKLIQGIIDTVPTKSVMMAQKLAIVHTDKWGEKLWRITVEGSAVPGREWLIENYFVDALTETAKKQRGGNVLVHKPLVHYADPEAERKFKRAVRVTQSEQPHGDSDDTWQ